MALKLNNVSIDNCGTGIRSNVPFHYKGGSITNCDVGMDLEGEGASKSSISDVTLSNLRIAILNRSIVQSVPQMSYLEAMDPEEREASLIEIAQSSQDKRIEVAQNGPVGDFLRRQNVGDWMALASLIGEGISEYLK